MARPEPSVRPLPVSALLLVLIALAASGCRSAVPPPGDRTDATAIQVLLRVEADLDGERESFRAVVRRWSGDELQVRVNDPLGRAVWQVDVSAAGARWSGRDGAACRIGDRLEAPVFGVAWPLSAAELGRWLLGEPPPEEVSPGTREKTAADARRWTFAWSGHRLTGWILVDAEGRRLEGTRTGDRATLRFPAAGLELAWSESRRELLRGVPAPLTGELAALPECRDASRP